jgi:D-aspartate ligase
VPRPKTFLLHSLEEMTALEDSCYQDMFLKPLNSQDFSLRTGVKAFQLESKQQALDIMTGMERNGNNLFPILLQEYIPGPASSYYLVDGFVDRHHQIRAFIARRRLRMYPPVFGNSTLSETIPLYEVQGAVDTMERMWSALKFRGIFDAEFKYDERDGQFKIVEVNARPWWFIQFATRCGMDLCGMSYQDALGLPVEPNSTYSIGRRCVYLTSDLAAYWAEDPGIGGLFRWIRSLKGTEDIIYSWNDPKPGISSTLVSMKNYLRQRLSAQRGSRSG